MTADNRPILENFEGAGIPAGWRTDGGKLELSTRHFKDGRQSLHWTWENGSRLIREGLALSPAQQTQAGMSGWVYCEKPIDARMTFRLGTKAQLANGTPEYQFRFGLNFTGWRMFLVQFEVDAKWETPGGDIEELEIAPPESVPAGSVYLDVLTIAPSFSGQRSADYQIPEHAGGLGGWCQHWPLHYSRQSLSLPLPDTVTEPQQRDFATIRARYEKWLLGDQPDLTRPGAGIRAWRLGAGRRRLPARPGKRTGQGRARHPGGGCRV
jgi:hypothetical protein